MKNRKNKITNLLKIGILFFSISLFFSSCEKDEFINYSQNQEKKTSYSQKTFGNIQKTEKFKEAFKKVFETKKQALNSQNRLKTVMEENYGFTIDTNAVSIISSEKYTSYTMLIHRIIDDETFYENLVIQNDSLNNTKAYILKYKLKSQLIPHEEHHSYEQDTEITVTPIIYDNTQSKMIEECSIVMVTYCPYRFEHVAGLSCYNNPERLYQKPKEKCISYDDGSDNDGPGGSGSNGGGSSTSIHTTPIVLNTNPVKFFEKFFSFEDAIFYAPSRFQSIEKQFSYLGAVGKFLKQTSFYELGDVLFDLSINQTTLNESEAELMVSKTVEILNLIKNVSSFDQLSLNDQKIVATNSLFLSFLPNVSSIIGDYWPKTAEEWAVINDLIKQFLPELILGFVPGSSVLDVVSGIDKGDATTVTLGIAGILVDTFGGSIFKGIGNASKVSYKVFKSFKIIHQFFRAVSYAIKTGLKTKLVDDIVYLTNSAGKNVAKITDDVVEIITDAGLKLINPSALKKIEKLIPTSSGYINSTKLGKAKRFKPSESGLKADFDNLKNLDNNQLGLQSETLANKLFKQDDYLAYDAKIPGFNGNNGFDGVYIKKDASGNVTDIIINEVKQVNSGSISLSPANTATGLPRQMTDEWIDNVIERMLQPNTSQQIKDLAQGIKNAKNQGKVTKVITGIDKVNNQILVFPIN